MVAQATRFDGIWSRKISQSAIPRNKSSRRSRPVVTTGAGACIGGILSPGGRLCRAAQLLENHVVATIASRRRGPIAALDYIWQKVRNGAEGLTMDAVKASYRAVTRQIEVTVVPRFLPDRSSPENGYFFWAYTIMLTNLGRETVQLKTR